MAVALVKLCAYLFVSACQHLTLQLRFSFSFFFMRVKQEAELRRRCGFGSVSVTSLSVNLCLLLPGETDDYREYRSGVASALH